MSLFTIESDHKEKELWRRMEAGDDGAREELIVAYRPLVFWLAGKFNVPSSVKQDLIQEGMIALINSADRFEYERGLKFSTFAWHRIRGQMINMLERGEYKAPDPAPDEIIERWAAPIYDEDSETWMSVEESIKKLPKRESEIISAIFKDGKEPREIASELGLDISHIYRLRRNAVARLKKIYAIK
ncbi:MAG: sigma-70 family RNA polymerase sigma factor [Synergistaceae bacterium]|nr:sigma-70 family RNA polymerase sigma factor [Synergistaceae bacterium]